ncbi:MAG: hypothetical protein H6Q52_1486, partial [Deltaproteobacteria bacterium]|nr:hypothetical protein [Deltaproteobacteria bacterium]
RFKKFPGDHSVEATPVPIPNTEVKLYRADDTAGVILWESRSLPGFLFLVRGRTIFASELRCLRSRPSSTYEYTPPVAFSLSPRQTQKSPRPVRLYRHVRFLKASCDPVLPLSVLEMIT